MSVAYYIVPEFEIDGFDHFVNGKAIGHVSESRLRDICKSLNVTSLHEFVSQDPAELAEYFDDDSLGDVPGLEQQWFSPDDGLETVSALSSHLQAHPEIIKNAAGVIEDLEEFKSVLTRLQAEDVRWYLALDF